MNLFEGIASWSEFIIRLIAAIGGFVIGYFISGPFWRLFWRGVFRKPVPPPLVPWLKLCTGLVLAALLYVIVHLGGAGGWGWGGGGGSGTGQGVGDGKGDGKSGGTTGDPQQKGKDRPAAKNPGREILVIELLGGARYPGEGKYYLLDRKEPAVPIAVVEETFKKRPDKIELHIYYSPQSVGKRHSAAERLREMAGTYQIPLVETEEDEKKGP